MWKHFYSITSVSRVRGPILKSKSTVQVGRPIGCTAQLYLTCVKRPHTVKTRIFLCGAACHARETEYMFEVHLSATKKPFKNFLVMDIFLEINASAHLQSLEIRVGVQDWNWKYVSECQTETARFKFVNQFKKRITTLVYVPFQL